MLSATFLFGASMAIASCTAPQSLIADFFGSKIPL
jgi:hypothetical protein